MQKDGQLLSQVWARSRPVHPGAVYDEARGGEGGGGVGGRERVSEGGRKERGAKGVVRKKRVAKVCVRSGIRGISGKRGVCCLGLPVWHRVSRR